MKKKKITIKATVDAVVWVVEDEVGNQEIVDIDDILDIEDFEEKYVHETIIY